MHAGTSTARRISAGLLVLQAFALLHLAVSAHSFDDDGRAFEREALRADAHSSPHEHVCSETGTPPAGEQCLVVASSRSPAALEPRVVSLTTPATQPPPRQRPHHANAPMDVLALAPKASPPSP